MENPLFVTGIGTGVGKTIVSAVLCYQNNMDYWKPVQAGDLHYTDTENVRELTRHHHSRFHPERHRFTLAASPHEAAAAENIRIALKDFVVPDHLKPLLIEGAGGLLVPLSDDLLTAELIQYLKADLILVIRDYLGCINHSLLTLEAIKFRGLNLKQVIFNGDFNPASKKLIISRLPASCHWSDLPELAEINHNSLDKLSKLLKF